MHRVPLAQREYLVVRVVGKTPRPAETTTRHCQSGSEGRSFGADPDRRFLGLCYGVQTRSLASCLRHQPRQEPRALTRMRGSVRGDWRKPVPYRDGTRHAKSPKKEVRSNHLTHINITLSIVYSVDCPGLLTETIEARKRSGAVKGSDLKRVTVNTTVMEKNIAHPTDARLFEAARRKLVGLAREAGLCLRQSYSRLAPRLAGQVGRYAHARQFKRMCKPLRSLKGYTGRVLRDIELQLDKVPEGRLKARLEEMIALVNRLLAQKPKDRKKLYTLHEPAVDCISRGKAHKRYEFGTRVSVATTNRGGFVIGIRALSGNPYDGHTLAEALEQVETLIDQRPEMAFVDCGYHGHGVEDVKAFISGAKRGVTKTIAKLLRRRSAIEPMIGHMKNDGRLRRSTLKPKFSGWGKEVLCQVVDVDPITVLGNFKNG